jgi:voltage-gated potassium channel
MSIRKKIYQILEKQIGGKLNFSINLFLIILIISSVIVVILESEKSLSDNYKNSFDLFEIFAFSVFTLDYMLRVWIAPEANNKHLS